MRSHLDIREADLSMCEYLDSPLWCIADEANHRCSGKLTPRDDGDKAHGDNYPSKAEHGVDEAFLALKVMMITRRYYA